MACINEVLTRALATKKKNARYAYIAPFFVQVKTVAWDYLKNYSREIAVKTNESELWVELFNGSRIYLFGADNPDRLRGMYLDGCILDEFADMKPSIWGAVIRPLLTDRKGWAVFIGTPKGHNAFYDIYRESEHNPEWFTMALKASTSGLLDNHELIDAQKTMSEDQYNQEFEISFEAAIVGSYYGNLLNKYQANQTKVPYSPGSEVITVWDIGGDGMAVLFYQMVGREPRLIDCYEEVGGQLSTTVAGIRDKGYILGTTVLPHDADHTSVRTGMTMRAQLESLGMRNIVVLPREDIDAGIELAKQLLPRLLIDKEKCYNALEAFKNYQRKWDEERKVYHSKPLHNWASHFADALRYLAMWIKKDEGRETIELKPIGTYTQGRRAF